MDRLFEFLRVRLTLPVDVTDRNLLDHFLATRDEAAFTELVRRYAPLVWGVCRRRFTDHDAEDAFLATFLVLLRRATRLGSDVPLGPWLHQVAVMTARNMARGNRRRAAVSGPLEHDVAAPEAGLPVERFDLDAALLALPERDRAAIVLCHLQGLSRREAAAQLGCPEGTLSARLSRALDRLRVRLGDVPAVLAAAGAIALPSGLSATMVRIGIIYTTSNLTAAGVSPAVVGITERMLRMFWIKKLTAGLAFAAIVAGGLIVCLAVHPGNFASATDPPPTTSLAGTPQALPDDPEAVKKIVEERLKELTKKATEIDQAIAVAKAEKAKLEEAQKAKAQAAELDGSLEIVCTIKDTFTLREVIGGRIVEMSCRDLDMLSTYLMRVFNDPKGPKKLCVHAEYVKEDRSNAILAAAAKAGFTKASLYHTQLMPALMQPNLMMPLTTSGGLMQQNLMPSLLRPQLTTSGVLMQQNLIPNLQQPLLTTSGLMQPNLMNYMQPNLMATGSLGGIPYSQVVKTEIDLTKLSQPKNK